MVEIEEKTIFFLAYHGLPLNEILYSLLLFLLEFVNPRFMNLLELQVNLDELFLSTHP